MPQSVGKLESSEGRTNTFFLLVFLWDLLTITTRRALGELRPLPRPIIYSFMIHKSLSANLKVVIFACSHKTES